MTATTGEGTEAVVEALRSLVVFGASQAGAYRELYAPAGRVLGPDIPTRLRSWLVAWAESGRPGLVVLTGNAGTGKTAATEAFCHSLLQPLPAEDGLAAVGAALVAKDVSGVPTRTQRGDLLAEAVARSADQQVLLCVNEGVMRDAAEDLAATHSWLEPLLDEALRHGAVQRDGVMIANLNRQRLTSEPLWDGIVDFLTREELWRGCEGCPGADAGANACTLRANVTALRRDDTRQAVRSLIRIASGDAVPTMRELLALLAYAICGDASGDAGESGMWRCASVKERFRDRGDSAFTSSSAYYNLLLGAGLSHDTRERSPLLAALARLHVGAMADLEVDDWLRDSGRAGAEVRQLLGAPAPADAPAGPLAGSRCHLDRVRTGDGEMTFHRLGETVSISEDPAKVEACLTALVDPSLPAQRSWRRRVVFEGSDALGGRAAALSRLSDQPYCGDLIALAHRVAQGHDVVVDLALIVRGLNFLVTGHADSSEGLIVPEPASLFARNPGSFKPARPAFVHSRIPIGSARLAVPDRGLVEDVMDVDHVEVVLEVAGGDGQVLHLLITPRIYQAVREADAFRGPVDHGTAEMTQLRAFYGRLAAAGEPGREPGMLVADPRVGALKRVQLPYFDTGAAR